MLERWRLAALLEESPEHGHDLDQTYREWNLANTARLIRRYEGVPEMLEALASAGVRMAVAMQHRMVDLQAMWRDKGNDRPFAMRIGINTGFCNVGNFGNRLAHTLLRLKVRAVSGEVGGIYCEGGLDPEVVAGHMRRNGKVGGCPGSETISNHDLLEQPVDILIPAAIENQLTAANADRIKARIVAELANGPTTPEADQVLTQNGVYIIPDFLCNAGGVTVSYFEMVQNSYGFYWTEDLVQQRLDEKMTTAFHAVHEMATERNIETRMAAYLVAVNRVAEAVPARGWV